MGEPVLDAWTRLAHPWRMSFALAWESFQARSIPIGAVLVDAAGTVVATGRNRHNESTAPAGQIAGSNVAHAELNALAALPPGVYSDHVLYTTVAPCLLCTGALRHSHVGTVRFATDDPMWTGMERLPELNAQIARRWARRVGPLDGPMQIWAAALPLVSSLERGIRSVVDCYAGARPDVLRVARRLAGTADDLRALTLPDALRAASGALAAG